MIGTKFRTEMIYESRWKWWSEGGCWRLSAVSFLTALIGKHGGFNEKCFPHRLGPSGLLFWGRGWNLQETELCWRKYVSGVGFVSSWPLFSSLFTPHTLPVRKCDRSSCLAFPDVMDSRPRQPGTKTSSFFLKLLGVMVMWLKYPVESWCAKTQPCLETWQYHRKAELEGNPWEINQWRAS